MPYIIKENRIREFTTPRVAETSGQLNYQFTMMARCYLMVHGTSYARINDVIGALEAAKLEFYRRVVVPYEDKKIAENGDVYDTDGV